MALQVTLAWYEMWQISMAFDAQIYICSKIIGSLLRMPLWRWRTYLLKPLQDQGLLQSYLNIVFRAMVQGKITYATPAWCGFLTVKQIGRINAFLKQAYKYVFCSEIFSFSDFADDADITLFSSMLKIQHCLHSTFPNVKTRTLHLRCEGTMHLWFTCVLWTYTKALFFPRCLYKFVLFRFILLVAFCSSAYFV